MKIGSEHLEPAKPIVQRKCFTHLTIRPTIQTNIYIILHWCWIYSYVHSILVLYYHKWRTCRLYLHSINSVDKAVLTLYYCCEELQAVLNLYYCNEELQAVPNLYYCGVPMENFRLYLSCCCGEWQADLPCIITVENCRTALTLDYYSDSVENCRLHLPCIIAVENCRLCLDSLCLLLLLKWRTARCVYPWFL